MAGRVAFGAVAIAGILVVVAVDVRVAQACHELKGPLGALLRRGSAVPICWLALILAGAVELGNISRLKGARPHTSFAILIIVGLVLTPWASAAGLLGHGAAEVEGLYWLVVWLLVGGIGTGVLALIRRNPEGMLRDAGATWFMIVYLGFLGAFALQLRCARDTPQEQGAWLLLIIVLVTKASDIGAYFVGSLFGKHRLLPSVSPHKSVEGAIGGLAASSLLAMCFVAAGSLVGEIKVAGSNPISADLPARLASFVSDATRSFGVRHHADVLPPILRAFFFGLVMSAAGQIGDLVESCFKRDAGIKDSGEVIPGYGGILDLLDSLLFAVPVGWFLLTAVWNVV